jgi:glutamate racemase
MRALEKACPLLVPLVEEGWTASYALGKEADGAQAAFPPPQVAVTAEVIRIYLAELTAEAAMQGMNPDALVLGCTHYPLLRPLLERAVPAGMRVIDSAEAASEAAARLFGLQDRVDPSVRTQIDCFATDSVEKFERLGSSFLGQPTGKVKLVDMSGWVDNIFFVADIL